MTLTNVMGLPIVGPFPVWIGGPMLRRRLTALTAAVAVVVSGLALAAPASAVGEEFTSLTPTSGVAGSAYQFTAAVTLQTDNTLAGTPPTPVQGGYYLLLPGFDYTGLTCSNVTFTPSLTADALAGKGGYCNRFIAGKGLNFASPFLDPEQATRSYTITITGLRAPAEPGEYSVGLANYDASEVFATQTFTSTGSGSAPLVTIDIDGNGGVCRTQKITGYATTWATAPNASDCQMPSGGQFTGFNTAVDGSGLAIAAGGNLHLTGDNRLYAIYHVIKAPGAPTDVVAVAGRNQVKVSWKAPADAGSSSISNYLAQATPSGRVCITRQADADMLSCTFDLPATNTQYSFSVQALNGAGWGVMSAASSAVSPYDLGMIEASRPNVLLGLGGTKVEASGSAPGLAGKSVNAEFKVGSATNWTTLANAAKVDAKGRFSWSRKFGPSFNKKNVSIRFTYGVDAVSGTYVLARGGEAGSLTAPRNIRIENVVNRVKVTWDPPKFDGGEKITGYTMCAVGGGSLCRNVSTEGRAVFFDLQPGREYTITVAARTAAGTGPEATAKQKVSPVEASVRISRRFGQEIRVEAEAIGFTAGAKFRLEAAVAVPGEPASAWRWEELQSFTGNGNVDRLFSQELGSLYEGETIAVRLVTPNGPVYSRLSRP